MATKAGTGVIYNVARIKMLANMFRWEDPWKFMTLADPTYVFDEGHATLADTVGVIGDITLDGSVAVILEPFISANGWAGSSPVSFADVVSIAPIGSVIIWSIDPTTDLTDPTNYELIACLTSFPGGMIYPDGSPFSLTFDQSLGQEGWFRP